MALDRYHKVIFCIDSQLQHSTLHDLLRTEISRAQVLQWSIFVAFNKAMLLLVELNDDKPGHRTMLW